LMYRGLNIVSTISSALAVILFFTESGMREAGPGE